jgi:hypothetical protein
LDSKGDDNRFMDIDPDVKQKVLPSETTPLIQESENCEIAWINHNPITEIQIQYNTNYEWAYPPDASKFE